MFKSIHSAKSVLGAEITAYSNSTNEATEYLYLIAGVHGDEPESVFVLEQLFTWLNTQNITVPIIVLPNINPDGAAAKTRTNANQVDLNRNFPTSDWTVNYTLAKNNPGPKPLSEPENIFLVNLFNQFKPKTIISFHSLKPILDTNPDGLAIAKYLATFNNYIITDNIGYPTPGSLSTYVDEVLKCGIITYELPEISAIINLQSIWLQNEHGLKELLLNLN